MKLQNNKAFFALHKKNIMLFLFSLQLLYIRLQVDNFTKKLLKANKIDHGKKRY